MDKANIFKAIVDVTLKKSILDPQGQTTLHALETLGFQEAKDLRVGKHFVLTVNSANAVEAEEKVRQMCEKVLINPVIEEYFVKIEPLGGTSK